MYWFAVSRRSSACRYVQSATAICVRSSYSNWLDAFAPRIATLRADREADHEHDVWRLKRFGPATPRPKTAQNEERLGPDSKAKCFDFSRARETALVFRLPTIE